MNQTILSMTHINTLKGQGIKKAYLSSKSSVLCGYYKATDKNTVNKHCTLCFPKQKKYLFFKGCIKNYEST